eukprot:Hpha_TRINITY_DN16408_c4_g2::TRINITY_DN16408_c4_g2_i2::g.159416::m.159416
MILYIVVGGSAVIMMLVSVLFVMRIVAPLVQLQLDMAEVAVMKLENVDEGRPLSALQEVGAMEESFKMMISNLREYRSYMPASVLMDDDDDEEEAETERSMGSRLSKASDSVAQSKATGSASVANVSLGSNKTSKSCQSQSVKVAKGKAA